jgi:hypothetical protein
MARYDQRDEESKAWTSKRSSVLSVAVVVLGYLYWDSERTTVRVDLPGIKIEGH